MGKLYRRIYFFLHRRRVERDLADEMDAHREMMPAHRRAYFGNTPRLQEESREAWSWNWFDQLVQDLAYGARVLMRARGFTLGAIAVLALGVGVNLAEFQIFDAMIFHRLTIRDAATCLQFTHGSREGRRLGFPAAATEFYRSQSRNFDWLLSEDTSVNIMMEGETGIRSNLVSANYFASLGIVPAWGRLLDARDAMPGAPAVAVVGYEYWRAHWGSDPEIIGRVVRMNNYPVQIVGVTPYSFEGLMARGTVVWLPVSLRPSLLPGSGLPQTDFSRATHTLYGKLKAGVSQSAGEAELTLLTGELARRQPLAFREDERIRGNLVQESVLRSIQRFPAIAVFFLIVLLVLLSACANLGNLLLARGMARQREIQIRLAIGASAGRIIRQLMTENLLLAILGALAGLSFGAVSARLLLYALGAPPNFRISMRWPIFAAGFLLTFLSALAFGLPSALQTVRLGLRKFRLRQSLVGVQVAVSCLLLIAAAVLGHNGIASVAIDVAFDYRNMVVVYPELYGRNLPAPLVQQKLDALSTALSAVPGVDGVAAATVPPFGGRVSIDNSPGLPRVYTNAVGNTYFALMNLEAIRGRTFLPGEGRALVVSESAAHAVWPDQDPLGKTWHIAGEERTVVGVVKDSGANLLLDPGSIEVYAPIPAAALNRIALILHTRGDPGTVVRLVPTVAARLNEPVAVYMMRTSRENILEAQRKLVKLIGSIGVVATSLAAAGMFALVAFAVAQRRRELAIRIAIGARPRQILDILLTQNARPMAAGMVAGVILAVILAKIVRSFIVLQTTAVVDPIGFSAGVACFVLVAALATLAPVVRALRIDPSTTLREE